MRLEVCQVEFRTNRLPSKALDHCPVGSARCFYTVRQYTLLSQEDALMPCKLRKLCGSVALFLFNAKHISPEELLEFLQDKHLSELTEHLSLDV